MTTPDHPIERLVDLLDGRLSAAAATEVRQHLEHCADCRRELAWLDDGRTAARGLGRDDRAPGDLRLAVMAALDEVDAGTVRPSRTLTRRSLVWIGLAAAAVVVLLVGPWRGLAPTPVDRALAEFVAVRGNAQVLEQPSSDAATLERYFNEPARGPHIRVIDLAMMGWRLEGGSRRSFGAIPSALYAYRSSDDHELVCQMYPGQLTALPNADAVHHQNGFEFRVYARGGTTLVFWQEGELVCVLAADLPTADVVALAIAKAMAPS